MNTIFSANNLTYEESNNFIIKNATFDIKKNIITIIKGPNGAGKTTLLKILFGMLEPTSGEIHRKFDMKRTELSYIFQNSVFLNRSVEDNLKHVLFCKNIDKTKWKTLILNTLKEFNLEYMLALRVNSLSGGELQLLALVRGILIHPDILFYDEPTNNLDKNNIDTILKMIQKFYTNGSSIIIVSHDDILIKMLKHNEILINKGCITT
jgi:ABC-type multidrug transport system ATPase subunit